MRFSLWTEEATVVEQIREAGSAYKGHWYLTGAIVELEDGSQKRWYFRADHDWCVPVGTVVRKNRITRFTQKNVGVHSWVGLNKTPHLDHINGSMVEVTVARSTW